MTQQRKRLSGPEKVAIVKRYLIDRVAISDLCDEYQLQPSQIYRWQAAMFEHGADVVRPQEGAACQGGRVGQGRKDRPTGGGRGPERRQDRPEERSDRRTDGGTD